MKIAPYVEKLNTSSEYHSFTKQYKDSFMVAGFFVLDFEEGKNLHQIDYYVPSKKKVAAFTLDHQVTMQMMDLLNQKVPEKLDIKTKIDLDALRGILQDEMKNRSITEEIKKIIAIIHTVEGKKVWSLNCVLSGMGILRASVEDDSQTVLKMEKSSIMDYVKKVPASQLAQMKQQVKPTKAVLQDELKKLDNLEKSIEAEKVAIQKKLKAPEKKSSKDAKKKATSKKK